MAHISAAPSCPIEVLERQVTLRPRFIGFDGQLHVGRIEVHREARADVAEFFDRALALGFPFDEVVPASEYDWDDAALMAANATSGFNYRTVLGTDTLSYHAVGAAIDVNPRLNPYCRRQGGEVVVAPPGASWLPEPGRPGSGVLHPTHPLVSFMRSRGWEWGGDWDLDVRHVVDYQHFQKPGLLPDHATPSTDA